jgi:hypothetical protein
MSGKQVRLDEFLSKNRSKNEARIIDARQRELVDFGVSCRYCGARGEEWIIKRGVHHNTQKGDTQRWYCKRCERRFSPKRFGNYPMWVISATLSLLLQYGDPSQVANELRLEAKRHYKKDLKISRQTVCNITERFIRVVLDFEEREKVDCIFREWQIDDTPQHYSQSLDRRLTKSKKHAYDFWWLTDIIDTESFYWSVAIASDRRDADVSEKAVKTAIKRLKGFPDIWRSDGLESHIAGIKRVLPNAVIFSKTKTEDFGHINLIEGVVHSFLRSKGVKKRKKFRSLKFLQILAELTRIFHNFLRPFDSLGWLTPAAKIGMSPLFRSWEELLDYISWH